VAFFCLVLAALAALRMGSPAFVPADGRRAMLGAAVAFALMGQQVQPASATDILLGGTSVDRDGKTVGDESRRIAAPLIDKSNLVKGVPFAGENAMQLAPKSAKSDDELLFGNAGINVLEYVRSKNGISGMMLFDSTSEEDSANRLLQKLR